MGYRGPLRNGGTAQAGRNVRCKPTARCWKISAPTHPESPLAYLPDWARTQGDESFVAGTDRSQLPHREEKGCNTCCRPGPEIGKGRDLQLIGRFLQSGYTQPHTNNIKRHHKQSFGSAFLFVSNLCHYIAILIA